MEVLTTAVAALDIVAFVGGIYAFKLMVGTTVALYRERKSI